jgi:two-component system cell cycle sensor histidine kinase/response regulator CckA
VYGIVVSHHGFLDVDSAPGCGSAFRIYLPLSPRAEVAVPAVLASDFPDGTESLLIVDDEESLRTLLTSAFSRKGYRTQEACTGVEAIEKISDPSLRIDAVILDLNMPGASGIEVLRIIRVCRPTVKVMVTSGHITPEARREFEQLSQHTIVRKPYRLDQLGRALRTLLDGTGAGGDPAS